MDTLNKTLFANSEQDLKKIYDEEYKKLLKNQLIAKCIGKLTIQDFKSDIPASSRTNIENALLAYRISDFLDLPNGQTLLDLDDFKLSKINLTYSEQKLIREKVQELVDNETKHIMSHNKSDSTEKKILSEQIKIIQLENENRELMLKLEHLKKESLELMQEVAAIFVGSDQREIVKNLRDETELMDLKFKTYKDSAELNQCNKTKYSANVLKEISSYLDQLIEKRNNE